MAKNKSPISLGIIAHVDTGKTTLAESIFAKAGTLSEKGRVDDGDSYLDTDQIERRRGITIFSKLGRFSCRDKDFILVDTPGHTDFAPEMERSLALLDYAVLMVSGTDGVVGYTKTLWDLLEKRNIPVFLFVNKMDQLGSDKDHVIEEIQRDLSDKTIDFTQEPNELEEDLALVDEAILAHYMDKHEIDHGLVKKAFQERRFFPLFFGSALNDQGVDALLDHIYEFTQAKTWPDQGSAFVYKVNYDDKDQRLTHLRLWGGSIKNKDLIEGEKIHEIRRYSGDEYESVQEAYAGDILALLGPKNLRAGQVLGEENQGQDLQMKPVLSYEVHRTDQGDQHGLLQALELLEEELPELSLSFLEESDEIYIHVMGPVLLEVLKERLQDSGIEVGFSPGQVLYKETLGDECVGIGHFEPLRHYAEVQVYLKPGERNSGLRFFSDLSTDDLSLTYQKQVKRAVEEGEIPGVLTGAALTDVEVHLVEGKSSEPHTESGDFYEAGIRAVRNALMFGDSVMLEPYYSFQIEVEISQSGKILQDLEKLGSREVNTQVKESTSLIEGSGPVARLQEYFQDFASLTGGQANLQFKFHGYYPSEDQEEILAQVGYNPLEDQDYSPNSVFCSHGSSDIIPWNEIRDYAHTLIYRLAREEAVNQVLPRRAKERDYHVSQAEIEQIFKETFYANANEKKAMKKRTEKKNDSYKGRESFSFTKKDTYLLVDAYNIIFAWPVLKDLAEEDMEGARSALVDIFAKYNTYVDDTIILVFDAYRVDNHRETILERDGIMVVFTKQAETADQYIQKVSKGLAKDYLVKVATSDGPEQRIVWGQGALVRSARDLYHELGHVFERANRDIQKSQVDELQQKIDFSDIAKDAGASKPGEGREKSKLGKDRKEKKAKEDQDETKAGED